MRLVMTLLVRNEADIVDAQIAFHLAAGVDHVIAMDNRSDDGTTEILERFARDDRVHLLREDGDDMRQAEWVTRMARMAATDLAADWVINADADEFWWPRGGTLKDVLALVPERYGVLRGCWRHFVPRPLVDADFSERMTARLCTPAFPGDKATIYHAHQKVAHRADPDVLVEAGNHNAMGVRAEPLRAWHPIEVLHFSLRSPAQIAQKARGGWLRNPDDVVEHQVRLDRAVLAGQAASFFESHVVSDEALARGLANGTYALDTRLRDGLRTLRAPGGGFELPTPGTSLAFETPDVLDAAAYSAETSVLVGIDGIVRAEERVAALEARLASLRTLPRR